MRVFMIFLIICFTSSCKTIKTVDRGKVLQSIEINNDFKNIEVNSGIELYLSQSSEGLSMKVETEITNDFDELLKINIENETLKLSKTNKNLKEKIRIYLKIKELYKIKVSEGAQVIGDDLIVTNNLQINSKEGSIIKLKTEAKNIKCIATSGCEITLSGKSDAIHFTAKNGSFIKSYKLKSYKGIVISMSDSKVWIRSNPKDGIKIIKKNNGKVFMIL